MRASEKTIIPNMWAARVAFGALFYGTKHPKYQQLVLGDLVQQIQFPEELLAYLNCLFL